MSIHNNKTVSTFLIPLAVAIIGGIIILFIQYGFFENSTKSSSKDKTEEPISRNLDSQQKIQQNQEFVDLMRQLNVTLKNSNPTNKPLLPRSEIWFKITSSSILFLLAVVLLILILFDSSRSIFNRIIYGLIFFLIFFVLGLTSFRIAEQVPLLFKTTWFANYVVNCIIQYIIIGLCLVLLEIFSDYILGSSESQILSS